MWALWFIPLIGAIFLGVLFFAVVYAAVARPRKARVWALLIAAPFGCAMMPIAGLMLLSVLGSLLQSSDVTLFDEVYGFSPEMDDSQMLSDDFGIWSDRKIYMRLEPTPHDRERILAVTYGGVSGLTGDDFAALAAPHQFSWWHTNCENAVVYDADGYRDWKTLKVYDCPERRQMYIVAFQDR